MNVPPGKCYKKSRQAPVQVHGGGELDARPDQADRDGHKDGNVNNVITVLGVVGGPAQAVAGSADEAKGMSAEKKKALKIRGDWQSLWRKRSRGLNQGMDGFMCHCCIHETFKKVKRLQG